MSFTAQITANVDGFSKGINQATKEIDRLQKTIDGRLSDIGKSMQNIGKKASILSAALVAAGGKAFSMAADFEDAMGATEQIFKDASASVQEWAKSLSPQYGIAKKEALEYSNLMGSMLVNIGKLTEEQASKQSAKLIELAGDLTAMYGGSTQDAVMALTGALKGNNAMLDNYGMAVNEALIKTKALEMGLISQGQEMSLAAKQAATLALIWEQTTAAQGQAAREADGASGAMRALRTEITNLSTEIGEVLLPTITPVITRLRDVVSSIRTMSPEMLSLTVGIAGVAAAAGPVLLAMGKLLQVLPAIKVAITALTGPVGLIVAAIAGAAALIISNWDEIKAYFTTGGGAEMFNTLKSMAIDIKNEVVGAFNMIKRAVTYIWNAIGSDIVRIFGNALNTVMTAIETLVKTFRNVAQILHGIFTLDFKFALDGLKNLFTDIFNGISRIVLNTVSTISRTLAGLFDLVGLDKWADGLRGFSDKLKPSISGITQTASEASNELTGLAGATQELVEKNPEIEALNAEIERLNSLLNDSTRNALNTANALNKIQSFKPTTPDPGKVGNAPAGLNLRPVIIPEIDTSLVDVGMGDLSAMIQENTMDLNSIVSSAITSFAQNIGEAFGSGNFKGLGAGLIKSMGQLAQQFGGLLISMGVGASKLQELIKNPYTAIAAGAALVALGAAASAAASKMVNNYTSSGGYSGGTSSYNNVSSPGASEYRGAYQDDFVVTFVQKGSDLVGVLDTAEQRRRRL